MPYPTEKLREHIIFTLFGLVLGALGTLGSLSVTYLLTSTEKLDDELRKEDYAFKQTGMKIQRGQAFIKQVLEAEKRSNQRMAGFTAVLDSAKNVTVRSSIRSLYELGLKGARLDLAQVSGHSPEMTGLPNKYHESVERVFKAEIECWNWVGRNMSPIQNGRLSARALAEFQSCFNDMDFERGTETSAMEDVKSWQDSQIEVLRQQHEDTAASIKSWRWRYRWSGYGVIGMLLILYLMIRGALFGKKHGESDNLKGSSLGMKT